MNLNTYLNFKSITGICSLKAINRFTVKMYFFLNFSKNKDSATKIDDLKLKDYQTS